MIISHDYKFIFIKTNKTAGTSIEIALSKFCGSKDIITPISTEDEVTRSVLNYRGSQNYLVPLSAYTVKDWARLLLRRQGCRFYNHISAERIKKYIDDKTWNSYYKFCFERNPWDRFLSFYYWRCRNYKAEKKPTITEFIESNAPLRLKRMGYDLYTINDRVVVDKICRFENLTEELEAVCQHLGIPGKLELPKAKSKYRKDKRSYQDILNEEERKKIAKLFRKEIDILGYQF